MEPLNTSLVPTPLDTLIATFVDTLATAVAAKLPAPAPLDPVLTQTAIAEAVQAAMPSEDTMHDMVVNILTDQIDNNREVHHKLDARMETAIDDYNMQDKVETALGDIPLADYFDINEAVKTALDADELDRKIDRKVDDKIDEIDWDDGVRATLRDIDLTDYLDVDDIISDYMLENFTELFNTEFDDRMKTAPAFDENKIRRIVREELRALLSNAVGTLPENEE